MIIIIIRIITMTDIHITIVFPCFQHAQYTVTFDAYTIALSSVVH